jgi:hypothetical protein
MTTKYIAHKAVPHVLPQQKYEPWHIAYAIMLAAAASSQSAVLLTSLRSPDGHVIGRWETVGLIFW